MSHVDVLDRLVDHYESVPAPAPSAELLAHMDAGASAVTDDHNRGAVVVPLVPRRPVRVRYLVAAMVATFVVFSGLAVAGALPDPIQRGVASVVSHVGIDLPAPGSPAPRPAHDGDGGGAPQPPTPGASTSGGDGATSSPTPSNGGSTPVPSSSPTTVAGDAGVLGDPSVPTALPPTTLPPGDGLLPPLDLPEITLPPLTLPQLTLPPLNLPPLLPLDLPGL